MADAEKPKPVRRIKGASPPPAGSTAERWLEENREAIESYNRYVEEHGLPLARYRLF